ncbi:MAG: glucose dehydrogenase [Candidatus Marinimicrobia bacterium]|jgi:glucose/arabinose dehydrogenase|nr:glucose dehydrogenase [Candidatus Neomarinimicrobiota bacterium]|tara:strand:- start:2601 stop:3758 length:1158 start_codon:yes stop_codon:yes gene_type:complete
MLKYSIFFFSILFAQNTIAIDSKIIAQDLERPLLVRFEPETNLMYIVQQTGEILIKNDTTTLFLDLSKHITIEPMPDERGLLGMAFDPDYSNNGFFYVSYVDTENYSVVSRFKVSNNKLKADINSEKKLFYFKQPFNNHNGGHLEFSPIDNYLYISFGDGGKFGDPFNHAQNKGNYFGKILRIDTDSENGYNIPPDNPFYGSKYEKEEIWAYGLRNPWRFSFDAMNGNMFIGDVGQDSWEEINYLEFDSAGLNFGWNIMEGNHCYSDPECDQRMYIEPMLEYPSDAAYWKSIMGFKEKNITGCSVTGGYIYRGEKVKPLYGLYIFSDFCSGKIWSFNQNNNEIIEITASLLSSDQHMIASFGEDIYNELYIVDYLGAIYKIQKGK